MTMSLKAFVYHHLYVCDEFKLDETASDTATVNKGYTSETSESSNISRKWSIRLLNYLKKHEDQENEIPSSASSSRRPSVATVSSVQETDEEDYSEENQATVTLHNLLQKNNQQDKPRTIVGLFGATGMGEPVTTTTTASSKHTMDQDLRRNSVSTTYTQDDGSSLSSSPNLSDDEGYDLTRATTSGSFLNFGTEDLDYFGQTHEDTDDSSSEEEKPKSRPRRPGSKHRLRKLSDVGPDGVSYTERRGRRYLQEKLKVYGDDQTIIVVCFFMRFLIYKTHD